MNKLFSTAVLLICGSAMGAEKHDVTVSAGKIDRRDSICTFAMPEEGKQWRMTDEAGAAVPLTVVPNGEAMFILHDLKAGGTATFHLEPGKPGPVMVEVYEPDAKGVVTFVAGEKKILTYQGPMSALPAGYKKEFQRGGYIHPLWTPGGKVISDDYPDNHRHHHGIWAPWTKTEFEGRHPDFWNMGDGSGRVEFVDLGKAWEGGAQGLAAKHRFVDLSAKPEPKTALNEVWIITVYNPAKGPKPYFLYDLRIEQEAAGESPLTLLKYHYGGLGYRGPMAWNGKGEACRFITSEGKGRANGNETTANWCYVGGKLDGVEEGITIFGDPKNFRAPQGVRLNPDQPFFCFCPSQGGDWKIEPGKPYVANYRFLVADGGFDKALVERIWEDYANPPQVTVK